MQLRLQCEPTENPLKEEEVSSSNGMRRDRGDLLVQSGHQLRRRKKNSVTPKDIPNANMACDYMWLWLLYNISIYSVALWNDIPKIYHCGSFSSHGAMGLLDPMGSTGTPRATPCLPSAFARGKFLPGCCRKCPDIHTGQILGMYVDHLAII